MPEHVGQVTLLVLFMLLRNPDYYLVGKVNTATFSDNDLLSPFQAHIEHTPTT